MQLNMLLFVVRYQIKISICSQTMVLLKYRIVAECVCCVCCVADLALGGGPCCCVPSGTTGTLPTGPAAGCHHQGNYLRRKNFVRNAIEVNAH